MINPRKSAADEPRRIRHPHKRAWQGVLAVMAIALTAAACSSSTPTPTNHKSASKSTTPTFSTSTTSPTASTTTAPNSTTTSAAPSSAGSSGTSGTSASNKSTGSSSSSSSNKSSSGSSSSSSGSCATTLSSSCDTQDASGSLTGAGSTFDQPLFSRAFYYYNQANPKVTVSYAAVGSGTGISDIQNETVNFGASDVPLSPNSGNGGTILEIPVALGGVAIAYNVPGVPQGLKLTGTVLSDIYLGSITKWNDSAITSLNPGVNLPNQTIETVHRADASGTSYIFTNYLNDVNPAWSSSGPGVSKSPTWTKGNPNNIGGNGNPGVAADISNTQYSIGYVELAYALQGNLTYAQMKNQAGSYLYPSLSTVTASASQYPNVTYQNFSIDNAPGANSYPICGYSWGLVYQNQTNQATGIALGKLFDWESSTGQNQAAAIGYAPLPANVQTLAHNTVLQMQYGGKPLF